MRKLAAALLGLSLVGAPVFAQSITDTPEDFIEPNSLAAQGCMKVGDCTKGVIRITSLGADYSLRTCWLEPGMERRWQS